MKTFLGIALCGLMSIAMIGCGANNSVEAPENPEAVPTEGPGDGSGGDKDGETAPEATVPPGK
jgi:hypothetical protein